MAKPTLLDICCGVGGASLGYKMAGFRVTGVDLKVPSAYLGDVFIQGDIYDLPVNPFDFDAVHVSPPCQLFSPASGRWKYIKDYPDLMGVARSVVAGHPYSIIENVPQAPMRRDLMLWGGCVGLGPTDEVDGIWRPRAFELSFFAWQLPKPKMLKGRNLCITKRLSAGCHYYRRVAAGLRGSLSVQEALDAMGYPDWVTTPTGDEVAESVAPPYARYIGKECLLRMREANYVPLASRRSSVWIGLALRSVKALDTPPF